MEGEIWPSNRKGLGSEENLVPRSHERSPAYLMVENLKDTVSRRTYPVQDQNEASTTSLILSSRFEQPTLSSVRVEPLRQSSG